MAISKVKSNATRVGAAVGIVSAATVAMAPAGSASAGQPEPTSLCIDTIGAVAPDVSAAWDFEEWSEYLSTCAPDFGGGKLIVDVVTDDGQPVPASVDLTRIVDAFDFGYADDDRDAQKDRFDPYCALEYDIYGRNDIEFFASNNGYDDDFRMDEDVTGRPVRTLQLLGDRDDPTADAMVSYDIQPNELLFSWYCDFEYDELRMLGVDDVGGGYQLLPGLNASFERFLRYEDGNEAGDVTTVQVVVSLIPVDPPTTTTTTTTTLAPTTTVPEPVTTAPPVPDTTPAATVAPAILPETGRRTGPTALLASVLLAAGLGCLASVRRRPA